MDRANIAANPGRGGAWSCATCGFAAKGCLGRAANVAAALSARSASYQAINPGKKNRSSNGDQDGVNRAALTRAAQQTHDPTTDDGAADTEQDVSDHAFAAAHDLAGHPAGDQTHDNPPQHMHKFSSSGEQNGIPAAVLELDESASEEGVSCRRIRSCWRRPLREDFLSGK